jgi:hypothetical protein
MITLTEHVNALAELVKSPRIGAGDWEVPFSEHMQFIADYWEDHVQNENLILAEENQLTPPDPVQFTDLTNPVWSNMPDGALGAKMSLATNNGAQIIFGPWGEVIPNQSVEAVYHGENIEREIIGWNATMNRNGQTIKLYLTND